MAKLNTPVAFFIFNRPDTTQRVFEAIRKAQPLILFIIADGPRKNAPEDDKNCSEVRSIVDQIDWKCKVFKNYSEENLGCGVRIWSGLDWVFSKVERAIILEDDCLPHSTFFQFCEELLDQHENDDRIMSIIGTNLQFGNKRTSHSYYYSKFPSPWGWATWRTAWKRFDFHMKNWPEFTKKYDLNDIFYYRRTTIRRRTQFQCAYDGIVDTWDFQWLFAHLVNSSVCICPNVNLISNIGWGSDATHTKNDDIRARLDMQPIIFPLNHPDFVEINSEADRFLERLGIQSLLCAAEQTTRSLLKQILLSIGVSQRHLQSVKSRIQILRGVRK